MQAQPVQFEIISPYLKQQYGGNFLLQVWNRKGEILHERVLQEECKVWNIQFNYFLYKPSNEKDTNHDCYHIFNLNNKKLYLIQDFNKGKAANYLFYHHSGFFFIADDTDVQTIYMKEEQQEEDTIFQVPSDSDVKKFDLGCKIWGFAQNSEVYQKDLFYVVLETSDAQLDFNKFRVAGDSIESFSWDMTQAREIVPRTLYGDSLKKVRYTFWDKTNYSVALRQRGDIDLYWNMQRVDSSQQLNVQDVAIGFDSSFISYLTQDGEFKEQVIEHSYGKEMRMNKMEDIPFSDFDIKKVFYQKIKAYCNMFESSCLIRTNLWVAHNKYVSVYNILENKWINHCKFSEYVQLFRKKEGDELFTAGIMYPDGSLFTEVKRIVDKGGSADGTYSFEDQKPQYTLPGKPFQTIIDVEDNRWFMFLSQSGENTHFHTLYNDQLYEIEGCEHIKSHSNVRIAFAPIDESLLIVQNKKKIHLYTMDFNDGSKKVECKHLKSLKRIPTLEGDVHSCISNDLNKYIFFVDNQNIYKYDMRNGKCETFLDHQIQGLYLLDDRYCYTLSHSNNAAGRSRQSGLRLYDL